MSERFIKINDCEKTDWLQEHYPNVFLFLTYIARHARTISDHPDGLEIGEVMIGEIETPKKCGLTPKQYRLVVEKAEELGLIEIIYNPAWVQIFKDPPPSPPPFPIHTNYFKFMKWQKRAIKRATKSKIVKIINSEICDIDFKHKGDQKGEPRASRGRAEGDKQRLKETIETKREELQNNAQSASPLRTSTDLLTFNFEKWEFEGISDQDRKDWASMYSHLDISLELTKATQWLKANPSKNGKKLWRKFLTGWFGRANDSLENKKAFKSAYQQPVVERKTKNQDGTPIRSKAEGIF